MAGDAHPLAGPAAEAVAIATAALTRLQLPEAAAFDPEALAAPLLRAEAVGSSFIEGLRASNTRVALAAHEPRAADSTAHAVLGNVRAMERAVAIGAEPRPFTLDDLLDIHRRVPMRSPARSFSGSWPSRS